MSYKPLLIVVAPAVSYKGLGRQAFQKKGDRQAVPSQPGLNGTAHPNSGCANKPQTYQRKRAGKPNCSSNEGPAGNRLDWNVTTEKPARARIHLVNGRARSQRR